MSFYLRLHQDGNIYIRNSGDPANGKSGGLSAKDILADDWEVLELSESRLENEVFVSASGNNFIFLNGTLYRLSLDTNVGELYKVK